MSALLTRGNGVLDSTLACYAGGPGLIPAVGKSKKLVGFFLLASGGRLKMEP